MCRDEEAYATMMLGLAQAYLGEPRRGERELRHAAHVFDRLGRVEDMLYAHLYLAEALRLDGRIEDAMQVSIEGERRARELGMYQSFGLYMALNAAADLFFSVAGRRLARASS